MGVLLIDPATGVEVSVSLERALALGWPTSDGKPLHAAEPAPAEHEAEEAVEPVKASKPRKSPAKSAKAKAASESEAAETW